MSERQVTPAERFWAKFRRDADGCWLWVAAADDLGYGRFADATGRIVMAYRFAYELLVEPIPEGLELDHLCKVPACVNPSHPKQRRQCKTCRADRQREARRAG